MKMSSCYDAKGLAWVFKNLSKFTIICPSIHIGYDSLFMRYILFFRFLWFVIMEANQVHPLLGPTILTLSRSSLPSKLQIINFIRFKTDSKRNSNQEKMEKYHEVAKDLISIWRGAYIIVRNASNFYFRISWL